MIVMVDRSVLRSPCMAGGVRTKRQTNPADIVPFNKTLLTAALTSSQSSIQNVRRVNLLVERELLLSIRLMNLSPAARNLS